MRSPTWASSHHDVFTELRIIDSNIDRSWAVYVHWRMNKSFSELFKPKDIRKKSLAADNVFLLTFKNFIESEQMRREAMETNLTQEKESK